MSLPVLSIILLCVGSVAILSALTYGMLPFYKALRAARPEMPDSDGPFPKASVIVYAECDEETLEFTIEQIMAEDYPDFEVIVVYEIAGDYAKMLNERLSKKYDNIYVTFIPPGSHNVSRRKLAITSGVKAATGEIIVTTCGNIRLPDDHRWLSNLLQPFCGREGNYADISLGLSKIDFSDLKGPGRWYRQFDDAINAMQWIGYCEMHRAYRGDGFNLAFRRRVFFEHKGYAKSINVHTGDDDLFIKEISTDTNGRTVINRQCVVTTLWPDYGNAEWSNRKEGYNFTARWLPASPFIRLRVFKVLQWVIAGSIVAAIVTALPSLLALIIGAPLLLIYWGILIYNYRSFASRIGIVRLWWAVMPFLLWQPVADTCFRIVHWQRSKKNFTWTK